MKYCRLVLAFIVLHLAFTNCSPRRAASLESKGIPVAGQDDNYFLFLSDVHLVSDEKITTSTSDAGTDLWDSVQNKIVAILSSAHPPRFILYTGDLPEHGGSSDTTLRNINIRSVFKDLQKFSQINNTPVFYLPGNNDALAGNYCFFSDATGRTPFSLMDEYNPYPYNAFHVSATPLKSKTHMISDTNLSAGYYSAKIMDHLRIISLNSVIWSSTLCNSCSQKCGDQQQESREQMDWLSQQLKAASNAGDKVYLAMHIPPGVDAYLSYTKGSQVMMWANDLSKAGTPNWQNEFLALVDQYRNTISGVFYGHTHMDEFRALYGNPSQNSITQVAISCPGISVRNGNNPGFKLVQYDPKSKLPVNFTTIYVSNVNPVTWAPKPYRFTDFLKVSKGSSIYESLRSATDAERKRVLDSIYNVKNGSPEDYDTLGLNVKMQLAPKK